MGDEATLTVDDKSLKSACNKLFDMTTDRALDILAMSEQARWKDGIEPEDVNKAVETIRKALQNTVAFKLVEVFRGNRSLGTYYYDETRLLVVASAVTKDYLKRHGYTIKILDENQEGNNEPDTK